MTAPLQGAALAPVLACDDQQLEVGLLLDALVLQGGEDADDVLLVPAYSGFGRLGGSGLPWPQSDVGGQSDGLCGFRRGVLTGSRKEIRLFLKPHFSPLWRQLIGRVGDFLMRVPLSRSP